MELRKRTSGGLFVLCWGMEAAIREGVIMAELGGGGQTVLGTNFDAFHGTIG